MESSEEGKGTGGLRFAGRWGRLSVRTMVREQKFLVAVLAVAVVAVIAAAGVHYTAVPAASKQASANKPSPSAQPEPNLSIALQQASELTVQQKYPQAEKVLTDFLAKAHVEDDIYHAQTTLGNIYIQSGAPDHAVVAFQAAQKASGKVQFVDAYGLGMAASKQFFATIEKAGFNQTIAHNQRAVAISSLQQALPLAPDATSRTQIKTQLTQLNSTFSHLP